MAASTKRPTSKKKVAPAPADQTPSEAAGAALRAQYADLAPSIERILASDLGEPGRMAAITLFRDSLGVPGDVHRDPRRAIESGRLVDIAPVDEAAEADAAV